MVVGEVGQLLHSCLEVMQFFYLVVRRLLGGCWEVVGKLWRCDATDVELLGIEDKLPVLRFL